jgi:NAD(P)-dependent dehydrogenase (short-subunit alcohol dehydrogenase family)
MNGDGKLALITGTSSGIGLALARALLDEGWRVIGMARREAPLAAGRYRHLQLDLGELASLTAALTEQVEPAITAPGLSRVALVNNAALIGQLTWQQDLDAVQLGAMFTVNAAAPMALMGFFAARVPADAALRVVNISSGAAHSPYPGLSDYGATKAALRLAGQSLAAEFAEQGRPPRQAAVLSYEPGLVDTRMQDQARDTSPADFPAHDSFRQFAEEGRLNPPEAVVGEIVTFLEADPPEHFSESRFGED